MRRSRCSTRCRAISLSPLQKLVGDVSGSPQRDRVRRLLILQWVAGAIPTVPAASTGMHEAPDGASRRGGSSSARDGHFAVSLGDAVREGAEMGGAIRVTGDAPGYALELRLENGDASLLLGFFESPRDGGALRASRVEGATAAVAMATLEPFASGTVATLRFTAGDGPFRARRRLARERSVGVRRRYAGRRGSRCSGRPGAESAKGSGDDPADDRHRRPLPRPQT